MTRANAMHPRTKRSRSTYGRVSTEWFAALLLSVGGLLTAVIFSSPDRLSAVDAFRFPKEIVAPSAAGLAVGFTALHVRARADSAWDSSVGCRWASISLVAFIAWSMLAAARSTVPWLAPPALSLSIVTALVYLIASTIEAPDARRLLLIGLIATAVAVAISMLGETYGLLPIVSEPGRVPGGVMGNRNRAAELLAVLLPAGWAVASQQHRNATRRAVYTATVVISAAVAVSRCRSAWLATLLEIVFGGMLLIRYRPEPVIVSRLKRALFATIVGVGLAAAIPNQLRWTTAYPLRDSLTRLLDFGTGTGAGRALALTTATVAIKAKPVFGYGPGAWPVAYTAAARPDDPNVDTDEEWPTNPLPQSEWIGVAVERGLPALLALGLFALSLLGEAIRSLRHRDVRSSSCGDRSQIQEITTIAGCAAMVGIVVVGSADPFLSTPVGAFLGALALGALIPCSFLAFETRNRVLDRTHGPVMYALFSVLVGGIAAIVLASPAYSSARQAEHLLDPPDLSSYQQLVRSYPYNYWLRLREGELLARDGRCQEAGADIAFVHRMFPRARAVRVLESRCGSAAGP